jgi:4-amino-4-deoxy-L-arabinose transferase-like glycosyltransferase
MPATAERGWLGPALAFVAAVTALRWALFAFDRTDLFVDEAQYWLWGQEFAFGYYSKPPLIAWLIGAVTSIVGSDSPFWIRMPGALLHALTALILGALAARLYGRQTAVWVSVAYVTLPMVGVGSLLISTDTVMAPFFAAALLFHRRLLDHGRAQDALWAGAMVGFACLAKYAGVYFLIGVGLSAVLRRDMRIGWTHAALMLFAFGVVIAPNIVWNLNHGFSTLSHTADNIGWVRQDSLLSGLDAAELGKFIGAQFAVIGPGLFAVLLIALPRAGHGLAFFVLPALLVVCVQALLDKAYANWAASAYFAGTVIAVATMAPWPKLRMAAIGVNAAICLALPILTLMPGLQRSGEPLLHRYLGRADLSRQIIAIAQGAGGVPIFAQSRDILADLFYTGQGSGLTFYAPAPRGRPMNHYEQRYPLAETVSGPLVMVTATPPACAGLPIVLNTVGGAYASDGLAAYLTTAECVRHAK